MNPRRLLAMLRKEWAQIIRDPSTLLIAIVLPIVLILLFGFGVSLDTARTRIGLAMQDDSAAAQSLAGAFQNSPYFQVREVGPVDRLGDELVAGRIRGILVVPAGFGRDRAKGGGTVQVITDGAQPNTASFVAAYATGVQQSWAAAEAEDQGRSAAPAIDFERRFWFNPSLTSRYFLVPGSVAIVMTMIGSLLTGLVVAREWERGTMEAILSTPVTMAELILTKVLPYFLLGLVSMTVCTVLAVVLFGVPLRGSPVALLIIGACFLVPALGQGLFISAATKNQFVASQITLLTAFLPSLLLSGFLFEISSMPRWVQWLTVVVPARYLIPQLQTVFVVGDDWGMFLRNGGALLGFGLIFFLLTARVTTRRVA
ncbi:ABC transporter permease [Sphingomonas sp. KRR8]|uniref:ABC transporter permease n=1 Tax=Sphingomonas sp. KRR8 TaxID=2942996 RepID=UPI002021CFCA|nr:ABC transporter permease [Sphingomonas sp. KRR8]URD60714.1 ABC transporter permease [Sphingomonas sp. KRR8]